MFTVQVDSPDEKLFTEKIATILDLPKALEDKALSVSVTLESQLSQIYTTAAPRDNSEFVWSLDPTKNKKAKGWWFHNLRKGNIPTDGRHYKRSGKPPYSVVLNVTEKRGAVSFQILMKKPKMRFVFGALNGIDTRNPSHKRTGWVFASPLINTALQDAQSALLLAMAQELKDI